MKIKVYASTSKLGSKVERVIEVEDDATDEMIDESATDTMHELIQWGWDRVQ